MIVQALLFDTYGTLVDWRSSVRDELAAFGRARGLHHDWDAVLADWKACYRPGMDAINRGEAPWATLETIYRHRLVELLPARSIAASDAEIDDLVHAWWRLRPWPDTVAGLNYDLAAAQALGLRTAFVPRPLEYGPGQTSDLVAEGKWDVVVDSVEELATALGC